MVYILKFIVLLILISVTGCTYSVKSNKMNVGSLSIKNISNGLPEDGQWRENIELFDINNDGFFDIVAPPFRLANKEEKIPQMFVWNSNESRWEKAVYNFKHESEYDYGGVAVGDIDNDGNFDIAFAIHNSKIVILKGNGKGEFTEESIIDKGRFYSRAISLSDFNGDGYLDIVAFSESYVAGGKYKPKGILLGMNKQGKGWDIKFIEKTDGLFGDNLATGDFNLDGKKDVVIAPLVYGMEYPLVWLGDGNGDFDGYGIDSIGKDIAPYYVKTGDFDGDKADEIVFKFIGLAENYKPLIKVYKWKDKGFQDISKGLELIEEPIVFEAIDVDGDGKEELIILSKNGLSIYRYLDKGWAKIGDFVLPYEEVAGAFDLKAKKNKDGSIFIVYNLGSYKETLHRGIRAFLLR